MRSRHIESVRFRFIKDRYRRSLNSRASLAWSPVTERVRPTFQSYPVKCAVRPTRSGVVRYPTQRQGRKPARNGMQPPQAPGLRTCTSHLSPGRKEEHLLSSTRPPEQTLTDPPQGKRSCPLSFPGHPPPTPDPDSVPVPVLTGIPDQWPPSRTGGVASGASHSGRAGPAPVDGCQNCGRKASAMRGVVANVRQLRGEGEDSRMGEAGSVQGRGNDVDQSFVMSCCLARAGALTRLRRACRLSSPGQ